MSYILLFFFIFAICMCIFSIEDDGVDDIPSEFDCIPEIANMKYRKQTYTNTLYLKHMIL